MPGKIIDRFALTAVAAVVFYLFFLNAWGSIPLACACAFLCCGILRGLCLRRPARFKRTALQAESALLRIAAMDDARAAAALERLVRARYPDEGWTLVPLAKYPGSLLTPADVFAQWRRHPDAGKLLIAATCAADMKAVMYARELTDPRVAVIDRRQLTRIIRLTGLESEKASPPPVWTRLRRVPRNLVLRSGNLRSAFFSGLLILLYLITGSLIYLVTGLIGLFLFGCALPGRRSGRRLF